jgi:hypothetical protein
MDRWDHLDAIPVLPLANAPPRNIFFGRGCCRPITLNINPKERKARQVLIWICQVFFCCVYTIPQALTSTVLSPDYHASAFQDSSTKMEYSIECSLDYHQECCNTERCQYLWWVMLSGNYSQNVLSEIQTLLDWITLVYQYHVLLLPTRMVPLSQNCCTSSKIIPPCPTLEEQNNISFRFFSQSVGQDDLSS